MSAMSVKMPAALETMDLYRPAGSASLGRLRSQYLCLDYNEPYWEPSPRVRAALTRAVSECAFNVYPDVTATAVRQSLSVYTGVSPDNIRVFDGSDNALRCLLMAFASYGVLYTYRASTYMQVVSDAQALGMAVKGFYEFPDADGGRAPGVVYICNPNNPDGSSVPADRVADIAYLADLVVVDEAYYEYTGDTAVGLLRHYENVVVVRSMSKAFALTGLRVGYTLSSPAVNAILDRVRNGKDVNALAQIAAVAALEDAAYMRQQVRECTETHAWVVDELKAAGVSVMDSPANFFCMAADDPDVFCTYMKKWENVLVRNLPHMPGWVRVTVGSRAQMEKFLHAVKRAIISGYLFERETV